ncbi:MAG: cyclodeaminase/cyclohydrolase family protein [Bacteroidota bacterium]
MLPEKTLRAFLEELASSSPAPGGGSVAAAAGAMGAALTCMVCNLTIGKKKYAGVEADMRKVLERAAALQEQFTVLMDRDTLAFNKVMEAFGLPKETEAQKALRTAAIQGATKEAALVPLEVMKHCIDAHALAQQAAASGNAASVSDAGVSALMLHAACEGAALNVRINLASIQDAEFVGWRSEEVDSVLRTSSMMAEETMEMVARKIRKE